MPKKTGFTKLPHGFHKRIVDFKDDKSFARLAVWLAHRCMEGKEGTSYPSLKRLKEYTGLGLGAVKHARRWLRANGWLVSTGQKHAATGRFGVPIEHTAVPSTVDGSKTHGAGASKTHGKGLSTADGSKTTEVVPSVCAPEVVPTQAAPVEACLAGCLTGGIEGISLDPFYQDLNKMFDTPASDAQVEAVISIIGEDQDLWYWVRKLAASKSWQKYIHDPESLLFRMSINPKTDTSAFMSKCRAALEGQRRGDAARKRLRDEAKEAGARRFVVDDCEPQPKFHGKRIA